MGRATVQYVSDATEVPFAAFEVKSMYRAAVACVSSRVFYTSRRDHHHQAYSARVAGWLHVPLHYMTTR